MKSTVIYIIVLVIVLILAGAAGIYFLGDPTDPHGLRQTIFCPLGLAKMPPPPESIPKERPQEIHTVQQLEETVKSTGTGRLKDDMQAYESYQKTMEKVLKAGKSEDLQAALKKIPGDNQVLKGNWDIFYYASCFCVNPQKTMKDAEMMKELRLEMKRKPCKVCNGSMSVPCKACSARAKKTADKKTADSKKQTKKKIEAAGTKETIEQDDGQWQTSINARLNGMQPLIQKKDKDKDKDKSKNKSKDAKQGKECLTCKGTGKTLCPHCVKLIREHRDKTHQLMASEIQSQLTALQKELVIRAKESEASEKNMGEKNEEAAK